MKNNKSKRKNNGFTLIELMVTIAIVGIFASIALPSFSQMIENNRISTATNELVSNLILARSEALKRSRNVTLCSSTNQTSCNGTADYSEGWIIFVDCDGNNALTAGNVDCDSSGTASVGETEIIKVHDGFNKLYTGGAANTFTFQFSGRVAGPGATFNVGKSSTELKKKVVISRVGRIKTEYY